MKKIENIQTIFVDKNKEIGVLTKYPFWMKWFMKFVELYIIPDVKDYKIKLFDYTFPCKIIEPKLLVKLKDLPQLKIGDIT